MNINPLIAPEEFIVGTRKSDNLCFLTYMVKGKMNSEISWRGWSENTKNPPTFKNEWSSGFKLAGNNKRGWGRTKNHDHILIEHPLCGKTFELDLDNFLRLAFKYTIKNGEIMAGLLMNNKRELIDRGEYSALLLEAYTQEESKRKRKTSLKIKAADLIPGQLYICANTGSELFYLGTVDITTKNGEVIRKFCYTSYRKKRLTGEVAKQSLFYNSSNFARDVKTRVAWNADYCTKSRKPISKAKRSINVYDHFEKADWKLFVETHERTHDQQHRLCTYWLKENDNLSRGYQSYIDQASKFAEIKVNFKHEYIQFKENSV